VGHLRTQGFTVKTEHLTDLSSIKAKYHIPPSLEACHTALVGGYTVEGHVPADLVVRLLRERPNILGLVVPGMPAGSPGMALSGAPVQGFQIFAFERSGKTWIFATR
jgi:hypothetical protein